MFLESSPLTLLCTIHRVTAGIITNQNDTRSDHQQYTIEVYVTTNESLSLRCFPLSLSHVPTTPEQHRSLPRITIDIASQAEVRLEESNALIIPHLDNQFWLLDCSASNPQEFSILQDMLTHFTKFENQKNIRNTLAMVSPSSYQVTHVIAENVSLDQGAPNDIKTNENDSDSDDADDHINSVVDADDFITTRENYYGQKLPVTMDENAFKDGLELRKVRLIRKTSECMDVSSVWLARGIVSAGDSIAGYIQKGSKPQDPGTFKTPPTAQLVTSKQRRYFDIVFGITSMVGNMIGEWFSKVFHLTAVKQASVQFKMPTPRSQLGNSAIQAAHRVMDGSLVATGTVLSASRQGLIQIIKNKYGSDAGYMARKIMGSDEADDDVMVYFDAHGISRKVIMQSSPSISSTHMQKSKENESSTSFMVYEDKKNEEIDYQWQVVYDMEVQDTLTEEKAKQPEKLVFV